MVAPVALNVNRWRLTRVAVTPIFGSSIFSISPYGQIYQVLCFDYADRDGYYERILHNEKAFAEETRNLHLNMAQLLGAERVFINGDRVRQKVLHVDIGLRGAADVPYLEWVIFFQGAFKPGENILASDVPEETAEYDIEVLYLWPPGTRIKRIETPMEHETRGPLLLVWARKGDRVGGHEAVVFELPPGVPSPRKVAKGNRIHLRKG
jgi:hypothetical protein